MNIREKFEMIKENLKVMDVGNYRDMSHIVYKNVRYYLDGSYINFFYRDIEVVSFYKENRGAITFNDLDNYSLFNLNNWLDEILEITKIEKIIELEGVRYKLVELEGE